ncbi:hypothetical protein ULMA_20250 [Patiriisocius marinus]|uniref:DUF2851 domain-containing protein n=1 Tax=Patiriisocius marinus TaxID=1397112 RepID=A0A5J4J616_9FLAO|nr:DUF2851 family protein [Patiriisocius marinus]GER59917.1 hypothetical protein ULMA_20250 [Patiriisocius marinus]
MKEDFLHYVWKFQKFTTPTLLTVDEKPIQIFKTGQHNYLAGPDFFDGRISIGNQKWAGNIEIHINSSDWYAHSHEKDIAYDNVILHVVFNHDVEIYRKDHTIIPTLELKNYIPSEILQNYNALFSKNKKFINCEQRFTEVDSLIVENWVERLFIERLELKSGLLQSRLAVLQNHWEALLFEMLCKNFGSKVNGASFLSIAQSVTFHVIQKCRHSPLMLETLLLGQSGLLDSDINDSYFKAQKKEYAFLKQKFQLDISSVIKPQFFRLRPPNFPTIRLSQLASLYSSTPQLFSKVSTIKSIEELISIFKISALPYWESHYNYGVASKKSSRKLTPNFIHLLIINTIIPLQFAFQKFIGIEDSERLFELAQQLPSEKNSIIEKFNKLKPIAKTALESQALLQLKTSYCDKLRCLECAIGNQLLKH